jgi:hypothetical protein
VDWGGVLRLFGFGLDGTWRSELITRKFSRAGWGSGKNMEGRSSKGRKQVKRETREGRN